ncbi:hypothetical protein NAAC61_02715 [Petrotoga sp. 8T1HF07.NaAc.6.1]|uniref:hypothetical protein n=1 Tax=Petrotoga sp. 8T1HF07.NaAc.6.1 TaxID=1351838 RepID=UPI00192B0ABB|nr:hypothetical protein [Petrotoga sp. 8T1HF07.NaAc.6.1]MBL5981076.1 hypothetical protein [Petrotoga sp. 8T1HF07.NaAc.6.1]
MSLYGNSSQLYFDFVYSDYMKKHSEFSYLLYVPSEATFSSFKKEFGPSYLDKVIVFTVLKGIKEGIFDTSYLVADSYPIVFNSFFNNKKSHGKFKDYKEYYRSPLEANFGVKPVSNSKPIYDKYGNPKNAMSYLGYKAHTITFLNVPQFPNLIRTNYVAHIGGKVT